MTFRYPPATPNLQGLIDLAGDLDGYGTTASSPRVGGLQGNPIKYQILGAAQDGYTLIWNNSDGYLEAEPITVSSGSVSPGTAGQIFVTNATPSAAWTSLINYDTVHGRFTSGGAGSDFKAIIGPAPGAETTASNLYLLPNAASPTSSNYFLHIDGSLAYINDVYGDGLYFYSAATSQTAVFTSTGAFFGGFDINLNFGGSITPSIQSNSSFATSFTFGTTKSGATLNIQFGAAANALILDPAGTDTFYSVDGYTRATIELSHGKITAGGGGGDFKAVIGPTVGAETTTASLWLLPSATAPIVSNYAIAADTASLYFNSPFTSIFFQINQNTIATWDNSKMEFGSSFSTRLYKLDLLSAAALHFQPAATTSATIIYDQSTTGNGNSLFIRGQDGYATNPANGGNVFISSGAKNSSGTDGYVAIETGGNIQAIISPASALSGSGSGYVAVNNSGLLSFTNTIVSGGVSPGTAGQIFVTNATPASTWTSLISYETTHGRFSAGGVVSESRVTIGPWTGGLSDAAIWALPTATAIGNDNYAFLSDGTNVWLNAPTIGGSIHFYSGDTNHIADIEGAHGRFQSGGSGSDFKAIIGPTPGAETTSSNVYLLPGATAPASSNYFLHTDGTFAYVSDIYGNGMYFYSGAATPLFNANVSAITTAVNLILGAANVTWANNIASPTLSQSAAASDVAPQNLTIRAQGPYASAVTHVQAGDVIVDIPANISGTLFGGGLLVTYAGVDDLVRLGTYANGSFGAIWFGAASAAPTSDNYGFLGDGTNTQLNAHGVVYIEHAGLPLFTLSSSTLLLGTFTAETYQFDWSATATFHFTTHATSATIVYDAQGSDVATNAFTVHAQDAYTSAVTHKTGGDLILKPGSASTIADQNGNVRVALPQSSITGTSGHGFFTVEEQGNALFRFGSYQAGSSYSMIWAQDGGSPSTSNYVFLSDGSSTYFNAPSGAGLLFFGVGGHFEITATQSHVLIGPNTVGGGTTSTSSMYFDTTNTAPAIHFSVADTSANIVFDALPNDTVAPADLTIFGQYAYGSATGTHRTPGNVRVDFGTPTNSGTTEAFFQVSRGGSLIGQIGQSNASQMSLWLGTTAFTSSNAVIYADGSSFTYVNTADAFGVLHGDAFFVAYAPDAVHWYFGSTNTASPFIFDWSTSTTPLMQSGSSATQLTVGTNNNSSTLFMQGGSAVTGISITAPGSTVGTATITVTGALIETTRTSAGPTLTLDTTTTDRIIFVTGSLTLTLNAAAHTNGRKVEFWVDTTVTGSNGSDITLTITPVSTEKINGINANLVITIAGNPKQVSKFTMIGNGTDILIV